MGKVVDLDTLRAALAATPGRVVTTNGCFDLLHVGHLALLREAKALGDILVVAVNDDASVRRLKGPSRPVVSEADRAELVAALEPVDYVVLFSEDTPEAVLGAIRPAIHVKGGDYLPEDLPEARVVEQNGGTIAIVPLLPGYSSTDLIRKAGA